MHRFYVEDKLSVGIKAQIKGAEARHIKDVLRLRPGAVISLFDGSGYEFQGKISEVGSREVAVDIFEAKMGETESPVEVVLGQGMPKADKMDLIIQKSTELGISRIVPLYTERVIPRSFSPNKLERWRKIALEACKQSGRVKIPEIAEPVKIDEFIRSAGPSYLKLIPWEEEKETSLKKVLPASIENNKVSLIIGPEGGLTEPEIELAKGSGFTPVSLGKRILRTETVSLSLLSIIQYVYGDIS